VDQYEHGPTRKWPVPTALAAVLLAGWAGLFWTTGRRSAVAPAATRPPRLAAPEKHYVTPQQLIASGALAAQSLGPVTVVGHDGRRREWKDLSGARPVVVVFIKSGCPCNVELEPFFHRLYQAYRGSVCFVGVIDGGVETARKYAAANHVPYLVLADPERVLISRFRAERGAYVALVRPAGTLDTLWPGCSAEMMRELSRRVADLAGVEEQLVETSGLPSALTTGCPFAD
jgi:peroxiredoxin